MPKLFTLAKEQCFKFVAALKECARLRDLQRGSRIHSQVLGAEIRDMFLESMLVNMYAKCGSMVQARSVFESMVERDIVSWNVLLHGYVENGEAQITVELFDRLEEGGCVPDARTYVAAIRACGILMVAGRKFDRGSVSWVEKAKVYHARAVMNSCCNMFVGSSLVDSYAKAGCMDHARAVFDRMDSRDALTWYCLVRGYVENGDSEAALKLFSCMQQEGEQGGDCIPDAQIYVAAITACGSLKTSDRFLKLEMLKALHSQAARNGCCACNVFVQSTLVDMYGKLGRMVHARSVFDRMAERDVVAWNCLIQGYVDNGENELAVESIAEMKASGVGFNSASFAAALAACGNLMALEKGKLLHGEIRKLGMERDVSIATCLVDFYGKCGSMDSAQQVFDSICVKDLRAWNALMCGYSQQGNTSQVLEHFEKMKRQNTSPNEVTFTHVLASCSHAGLVDQGRDFFNSMKPRYGINPDLIHYTCMVDLLGRANRLDEALKLVWSMPFEAGRVTWTSLLGACRKWNNAAVGRVAYDALLRLDERDSRAYNLMANIYGGRAGAATEDC